MYFLKGPLFNKLALISFLFFALLELSFGQILKAWPEIKEQAEKAMVEDKPQQALKLVNKFLKSKPSAKTQSQAEEFLNQITQTFITSEGHKHYYLAKSLRHKDVDRAISELKRSQTYEPINHKVALDLAAIFISVGQCDNAEPLAQKAFSQNKGSLRAWSIYLQALHCLKSNKKFAKIFESYKNGFGRAELEVKAFSFLVDQNATEDKLGGVSPGELIHIDPQFPLAYYWQVQMLRKIGKEFKEPAETYLSICKKSEEQVVDKYENFPGLCNHTEQVKSWL